MPPTSDSHDSSAALAAHHEIDRIDALSTHHDVTHDGVQVRWRRFGGDTPHPPLVLLHGGHGSWMHWLRNVEALSADRTLWLPDMPGFHDSGTLPAAVPGGDPAEPLLAVLGGTLDALVGVGTAIDLCGFSFGGVIAQQLALRRGAVWRLALVGSGGHGTQRRMAAQMINWRVAKDRDEKRAALTHNLGVLMLHDPAAIDELAFQIHDISCHATRFRSKEISRTAGMQAALDAIDGPQLLVWGEHDPTADPWPLLAPLTAGQARREGVVIEGAGHWVQYERADEFNRLLARFFG